MSLTLSFLSLFSPLCAHAGIYVVTWGGNYPGAASSLEVTDSDAKEFDSPMGFGKDYRCRVSGETVEGVKAKRTLTCQDYKAKWEVAIDLECKIVPRVWNFAGVSNEQPALPPDAIEISVINGFLRVEVAFEAEPRFVSGDQLGYRGLQRMRGRFHVCICLACRHVRWQAGSMEDQMKSCICRSSFLQISRF